MQRRGCGAGECIGRWGAGWRAGWGRRLLRLGVGEWDGEMAGGGGVGRGMRFVGGGLGG